MGPTVEVKSSYSARVTRVEGASQQRASWEEGGEVPRRRVWTGYRREGMVGRVQRVLTLTCASVTSSGRPLTTILSPTRP